MKPITIKISNYPWGEREVQFFKGKYKNGNMRIGTMICDNEEQIDGIKVWKYGHDLTLRDFEKAYGNVALVDDIYLFDLVNALIRKGYVRRKGFESRGAHMYQKMEFTEEFLNGMETVEEEEIQQPLRYYDMPYVAFITEAKCSIYNVDFLNNNKYSDTPYYEYNTLEEALADRFVIKEETK